MAGVFSQVGGLRPRRSVFNLSHSHLFDADMGLLYPILVEDCLPGDVWNIGNEIVVRFHQPLFAPILHEVNVTVHYFFVPIRLLWHHDHIWSGRKLQSLDYTNVSDISDPVEYVCPGSWEDFLSGGPDGTEELELPRETLFSLSGGNLKQKGSIIDYLYGVSDFGRVLTETVNGQSVDVRPVPWPRLAYSYIYNEYYRDENLIQDELEYGEGLSDKGLFRRAWEKDYFTSALPWRQRGTSPALPLSFTGRTVFDSILEVTDAYNPSVGDHHVYSVSSGSNPHNINRVPNDSVGSLDAATLIIKNSQINDNHISIDNISTFDINDLRLGFQVQKWLERSARAGIRYTEILRSHFGVSPRDERLDRPEYIGGTKAPVVFSEVLQTSSSGITGSDTPQGNLAGHGLSASSNYVCKYRVQEYGVLMGILSVRPRTMYQQGVNRMWLRDDRWDLYYPEFAHLGEQPVYEEEIMLHASTNTPQTNREVFGYQGRFNEYRYRKNQIHGNLRDSNLNYWHLGRIFDTSVANRPRLNRDFIECKDPGLKRIYPIENMPGMIINVGNIIKAVRPLPVYAEPGLIDHY